MKQPSTHDAKITKELHSYESLYKDALGITVVDNLEAQEKEWNTEENKIFIMYMYFLETNSEGKLQRVKT